MLRLGKKVILRVQDGTYSRLAGETRRHFSDGSRSSGSMLKTVAVTGGIIGVGAAGTVAYAKVNTDFRHSVENYLPGSQSAFNVLLGPSSELTKHHAEQPIKTKEKKKLDPFEQPMKTKRKAVDSPATTLLPENAAIAPPRKDDDTPQLATPNASDKQEETVVSMLKDIHEEALTKVEELPQKVEDSFKEFKSDTMDLLKDVKEDLLPASETNLALSKKGSTSGDPGPEVPLLNQEAATPQIKGEAADVNNVAAKLAEQERDEAANTAATTAILESLLSSCSIACSNAILANEDAANATALHSSLLRTAVDDSKDAEEKSLQWEDVGHALQDKLTMAEKAGEASLNALEELTKMRRFLEDLTVDNDPIMSEKLIEVDRDCMGMSRDLENSKAKVRAKDTEADALSRYLQLVEDAKEKFRADFAASLPDTRSEPKWKREGQKLSRDDEAYALLHMQRLIEQLKAELSEERAKGEERLQEVVSSVKVKVEESAREEASRNLQEKLEEQMLTQKEKDAEASRKHEQELRLQLKRQAAAHVEHMSEALAYMERQAATKYEKALNEKIEEHREQYKALLEEERAVSETRINALSDKYHTEMGLAIARVSGIEQAVDGRAQIENVSRKAQELSLACDALMVAMRYGDSGRPVPLATELEGVKKVCDDNPDVTVFSNAIPMEATERGVYTEEYLRGNFQRLAKICRRLSLVDENRNSLFVYFLSYLKSFLTISSAQVKPPTSVDQSDLDVFTIISYTNYCLQHGDLEQAARFVNQLTGEPRRVADGWLKEARLLLETRQAVEALSALSKALVIGAQLEK